MHLLQAGERFLAHCQHVKNLSDHTLRAYQIDLKEFQRFASPTLPLEECNRHLLRDYMAYLSKERRLKATSIKRRLAFLKAMFRWLELEDYLDDNPFRRMDTAIKCPTLLPRDLTQAELRRLFQAPLINLGFAIRHEPNQTELVDAASDRYGFLQLSTLVCARLLFATGVRVGELVQIQLHDIDLEDRSIRITGKGHRERIVFVPDQRLKRLIKAYLVARINIGAKTEELFINSRGGGVDTQFVRMLIRKAGEAAKLERRITPHMLRHSAATQLIESGIDIRYVQRLLGHQSITTTQRYTHVNDLELKRLICREWVEV